jgi:hypothetical protein
VIPHLRERFNQNFTEAAYQRFLQRLNEACGVEIEFRPCETPVFLPPALLRNMVESGQELIRQLQQPDYLQASTRALPAAFHAPNEGAHPDFIQVDFAVTRDEAGQWQPQLIELQGCASLYAFQFLLPHAYQEIYDLKGLRYLLSGLTDESYLALLRNVLLNGHDPAQVVLMEVEPEKQKTRPDFLMTEKLFGIRTVDVAHLRKRGRRLTYECDGKEIEIARLYNRVIIDEFARKNIQASFDFRDELEVEWAGHPNWYFRWSKFSLPYLKHPSVPRAYFLDQIHGFVPDLEKFVLKPLFSFAGSGVKVNVTMDDLEAIPLVERGDYLLQEKVAYAPAIATLDEPSKVEVRIMFVWLQGAAEPTAVTTLTRLSKGAMMGVDFNKNKSWVGSSCSFFESSGAGFSL